MIGVLACFRSNQLILILLLLNSESKSNFFSLQVTLGLIKSRTKPARYTLVMRPIWS